MRYTNRRTFLADLARSAVALPLIDWPRDSSQQRVPRIGFMSGAEPHLNKKAAAAIGLTLPADLVAEAVIWETTRTPGVMIDDCNNCHMH